MIAIAIPAASAPPPIGTTTIRVAGRLRGDLEPDRPLARDHRPGRRTAWIEGQALVARRSSRAAAAASSNEPSTRLNLAAVRAHRLDLRERRVGRHAQHRVGAARAGGDRDRLRVVAGAGRDHSGLELGRLERRDPVLTRRGS